MTLLLLLAALASEPKRETFQNAQVFYGRVGKGLRTFVTRPTGARGKVPAIFFVGWLSCDSMEYRDGETDGFGAYMLRLIEQSGYATLRMDKPGVGESEGLSTAERLKVRAGLGFVQVLRPALYALLVLSGQVQPKFVTP